MSIKEPIRFYRVSQPYGCFSNFSPHPMVIDGVTYPTSEHYYQSKKFESTPLEIAARSLQTPKEVFNFGKDKNNELREDWELIKDCVMERAVFEKFRQNPSIKKILLETDDREIIEASPYDSYWGEGKDGYGKNMLGIMLMKVRNILKQEGT